MVDKFDILSLLMPDEVANNAIIGSDPYLAIKQAPDLVSQVLLKASDNPAYSMKDKVLGGLLTGLTGGVLGGLSSDYQTRARSAYQDALFGAPQADVLSDDIFAIANQKRKQASIFDKLLGEQEVDASFKEQAKVRNQVLGNLAQSDDPSIRNSAISQLLRDNEINLGTEAPQPIGEQEGDATSLKEEREQLQRDVGSVKIGNQLFADKQKKKGEGLGVEESKQLALSGAFAQSAVRVADVLDKSGLNWAKLRLAKNFSAFDKTGVGLAMADLADRLTRARTGAALNANEQKLYDFLVGGDLTTTPEQASKLMRILAAQESEAIIDRATFGGRDPGVDLSPYKSISSKYGLKANGDAPTKVVNGSTYQRVQGGWQKVR